MLIKRFPLFDCHCHLQTDCFDHDRTQVIARAKECGVDRFFCNGTTPTDWKKTLQISQNFPEVVPCFGLHPVFVSDELPLNWWDQLQVFLSEGDKLLSRSSSEFPEKTPVGEIGLDQIHTAENAETQEMVFREQLRLAQHQKRTVILHTRRSLDRVLEILTEEGAFSTLIFHGFSGPASSIPLICKMNGYFSFSANILKQNHQKVRTAAIAVPLNRILLESDAPDMPPPVEMVPKNWNIDPAVEKIRNEPSILPKILEELANLRGITMSQLMGML